MRIKGRKLWVRGVAYDIDVETFRTGDGETNAAGYITREDRRIAVDRYHQDDCTLAHEAGHAVCDQLGLYLSENQMILWEELFVVCRDPRNSWLAQYLFGRPLKQ